MYKSYYNLKQCSWYVCVPTIIIFPKEVNIDIVLLKESAKLGLVTKRKCWSFIFQGSDATWCYVKGGKETCQERYLFWLFNKYFFLITIEIKLKQNKIKLEDEREYKITIYIINKLNYIPLNKVKFWRVHQKWLLPFLGKIIFLPCACIAWSSSLYSIYIFYFWCFEIKICAYIQWMHSYV